MCDKYLLATGWQSVSKPNVKISNIHNDMIEYHQTNICCTICTAFDPPYHFAGGMQSKNLILEGIVQRLSLYIMASKCWTLGLNKQHLGTLKKLFSLLAGKQDTNFQFSPPWMVFTWNGLPVCQKCFLKISTQTPLKIVGLVLTCTSTCIVSCLFFRTFFWQY